MYAAGPVARRKYPHANEGSCEASNVVPSPTWRSRRWRAAPLLAANASNPAARARSSAPAMASVVPVTAALSVKRAEAYGAGARTGAEGDMWCLIMRHPSGSLSAPILGVRAGDRGEIVAFGTTERTPLRSD